MESFGQLLRGNTLIPAIRTGSDYIFKIFILKLLSGYHMDIFQMGHTLKCDIKYQKLFFRHFVFGWLWIWFLILMCYHIIRLRNCYHIIILWKCYHIIRLRKSCFRRSGREREWEWGEGKMHLERNQQSYIHRAILVTLAKWQTNLLSLYLSTSTEKLSVRPRNLSKKDSDFWSFGHIFRIYLFLKNLKRKIFMCVPTNIKWVKRNVN